MSVFLSCIIFEHILSTGAEDTGYCLHHYGRAVAGVNGERLRGKTVLHGERRIAAEYEMAEMMPTLYTLYTLYSYYLCKVQILDSNFQMYRI